VSASLNELYHFSVGVGVKWGFFDGYVRARLILVADLADLLAMLITKQRV